MADAEAPILIAADTEPEQGPPGLGPPPPLPPRSPVPEPEEQPTLVSVPDAVAEPSTSSAMLPLPTELFVFPQIGTMKKSKIIQVCEKTPCDRKLCATCNPCLKMYDGVRHMQVPGVNYAMRYKYLVNQIEASQMALLSVNYKTLGTILSLAKLSLVSLFDAFGVKKEECTFHNITFFIEKLDTVLIKFVKETAKKSIPEAYKQLEQFHAVPNKDITSEVLSKIFTLPIQPGTNCIKFIEEFFNDSTYFSIFATQVYEKLVRCVERANPIVGNIIVITFHAIAQLMDILYSDYIASLTDDFDSSNKKIGGMFKHEFIRMQFTAQLTTSTHLLFTYLFKHRTDIEINCAKECERMQNSTDAPETSTATPVPEKKSSGFFSMFSSSSS